MSYALHIVLVEPEIPQNTGNIVRLCSALDATLHLVKPLGFLLEDKYLKRAGLDYWPLVEIKEHENYEAFEASVPLKKYLMTTKGRRWPSDMVFAQECCLIFGGETKGLASEILQRYPEEDLRLPMCEACRCLNLSNAVAVTAYEVMRQWGYPNLY